MNWWRNVVPPVRWMIYLFSGIIILSMVFAPEPSPADYLTPNFSYTSSAKLYFHNVRSFYYQRTNEDAAGFYRYTLKKQLEQERNLPIQLSILDNWRNDEVYMHVDFDTTLRTLHIDTNVIDVKSFNNIEMHQIAASLFIALSNDDVVKAVYSDSSTYEYNKNKDRSPLETILFDYFKLLNVH